jgi:hypothetical protein
MNKHAAVFAFIENIVVDKLRDERDGAHLAHQRRVKADFVHAIEDFCRCHGQLLALDRIDVDQDHVFGTAIVNQWKDCGIAHEPAVPIVLAIDFDSMEKVGQAGRRKDHVDRYGVILEHLDLARADIGGGKE